MRPRCARRTTSVLCPAAFQVPRTAWHRWCEHQSRRSLGPWGRPRLLFTALWFLLLLYIHMYIYKRYMRVYNYYHFFDWFLKKTVVRELRNKNGYWGGGKTVISWGSSAISLPPWRTLLAEATGAGQCRLTGLIGMDFSWLFGVYLLHFREITVTEEW